MLVVILGIVIAAIFYSGPNYNFDDANYITYAKQFIHGNFVLIQSPYAFGYLVPLLVAISFTIFGVSSFSAIIPTLIEYVLIIVITFFVGRALFSEEVGIVGSFLVATSPFVFGYATRVIPDMLLGVLAGLALYALSLGIKNRGYRLNMILVSGLISGLMVFVKLGGVGFGIMLFIIMLVLDTKITPTFISGFIISIALYLVLFYFLSGGNFSYISWYSATQVELSNVNLGINILMMFGVLTGPILTYQTYPLGLITLFIIISSVIALKRRNKKLIYLASLFWFTFFYLFFGTESLSKYVFITVVDRYFILVAVPMALLGAYPLVELYELCGKHAGKRLAIVLLGAIVFLILILNLYVYNTVYAYNSIVRKI